MLDEASKQRVKDLCDQIAREDDRNRFSLLISELNQIFDSADVKSANNFDGANGNTHPPGVRTRESEET